MTSCVFGDSFGWPWQAHVDGSGSVLYQGRPGAREPAGHHPRGLHERALHPPGASATAAPGLSPIAVIGGQTAGPPTTLLTCSGPAGAGGTVRTSAGRHPQTTSSVRAG